MTLTELLDRALKAGIITEQEAAEVRASTGTLGSRKSASDRLRRAADKAG